MNCPKCTVANPDGKKYCGDCGTLLDPNLTLVTPEGRALLKALLKEEFKDREVVEHEIAFKVWDLFHKRTVIVSYILSSVVGGLMFVFSLVGWKQYSDVSKFANDTKTDLQSAYKDIQTLKEDIQKTKAEYEQVKVEAMETVRGIVSDKSNENKKYIDFFGKSLQSNPGLAAEVVRKTTDPSIKDALQVITETAQTNPGKIETLPTVFVQFKGDIDRTLVKGFRDELNQKQLPAPGEERIPGTYSNEVRYFDPGDATTAQTVASLASDYFKRKNCSPNDFQVKLVPSSTQKNLKGQVEVWISGSCKGT